MFVAILFYFPLPFLIKKSSLNLGIPSNEIFNMWFVINLCRAGPMKKGHHMGDYIPQEELEKFMANCNDAAAQKAAKEAAEKAKIQADNVGHKLLSKMGWKEGI